MKRVFLVGGSGMLGSEVKKALNAASFEVVAPSHTNFDCTWPQDIEMLRIKDFGSFDWVINCSGYTAVDNAESDTMAAMTLNGIAPGSLAFVCAENSWKFLHVSTDFLFDGRANEPYTEESPVNPLGVYGKSKYFGEQNVQKECPDSLIVRTAWLFGAKGACFPKSIIRAWMQGKELQVVTDQVGSPTFAPDLARCIGDMIALDPEPGIYNAVGPDTMSWFEFANLVLKAYAETYGKEHNFDVKPILSKDWQAKAKRPPYSILSTAKMNGVGISPMRPIEEALAEFCKSLTFGSDGTLI